MTRYNLCMNGCDRVDQMVTYYGVYQRKTYKWWKKLFRWALKVVQNNAYVLYTLQRKNRPGKTSLLRFKLELVHGLTKYAAAIMPASERLLPVRRTGHPKSINLVECQMGARHLPRYIKKDSNCVHCSNATSRKCPPVSIGCPNQPHLCVKCCFEEYHIKLE